MSDKAALVDGPEPREGVVDRPTETAQELIDALRPHRADWDGDPLAWIFRGQADAEWFLDSKAVRKGGRALLEITPGGPRAQVCNPLDWPGRKSLHNRMMKDFLLGLDRSGIDVPRDNPSASDESDLRKWAVSISPAEPIPQSLPLVALAQHHGLPTILLDWTRRPLVAAYFAAVEAADRIGRSKLEGIKHLAVWAFKVGTELSGVVREIVYEAPGATNPNLAAQSGVFTRHKGSGDWGLEFILSRDVSLPGYRLLRFTTPIGEAPRLLRLLAFEGVTGASMFPGPDGVVKSMRERLLWDTDAGLVPLS